MYYSLIVNEALYMYMHKCHQMHLKFMTFWKAAVLNISKALDKIGLKVSHLNQKSCDVYATLQD